MTRRNRNTHARLAAWLLGAVLATAPTLALAHGPEAKAVKARLAPLSDTLEGINAQVQTLRLDALNAAVQKRKVNRAPIHQCYTPIG